MAEEVSYTPELGDKTREGFETELTAFGRTFVPSYFFVEGQPFYNVVREPELDPFRSEVFERMQGQMKLGEMVTALMASFHQQVVDTDKSVYDNNITGGDGSESDGSGG